MNIAEINTSHYGSTGKIMLQIAEAARQSNHTVLTFSKTWKNNPDINENHYYLGTYFGNVFHRVIGPLFSREGSFSHFSTVKLIKKLKKFSPDVIHLHNLHGWYINYKMLFEYIKEENIPVIWTLHDCWAFTGQCPYFTLSKCDKWKNGCHHCTQYRSYPETFVDRTKVMWKKKMEWFTGIKNMTVVTPSQWLADLAKESYLKKYTVRVINNGIDLTVFKPTESDFRTKYHCENKFILLGVAFGWGIRKGLDVFIELANRLDDTYQIVMVGTSDKIDTQLPKNIISIHRTQNQAELAEIYTVADLFVNPTREENYPTVNMESLACGTPVVTFKTGGSPEIIDETCGAVVEYNDIDALEKEIIHIREKKLYPQDACLKKSREFYNKKRFEEYVGLYEQQ